MPDSDVILLYDAPGNCADDRIWSPNVWKVRYILNYKRIPYKTVWVELPDVENLAKELGAPPTGDEWPVYGVPIIYDPVTRKYVSNSLDIARHLDVAYPDTPALFPPGTEALIRAWEDMWMEKVFPAMVSLAVPGTHDQLNPASQPHFRKTREAFYGKTLEELRGDAEVQRQAWRALEAALARVDGYKRAPGPFVAGKDMTYADVLMAGWLVWVKRIAGPESEGWKRTATWHGGRWERFMDEFNQLEYTEDKIG